MRVVEAITPTELLPVMVRWLWYLGLLYAPQVWLKPTGLGMKMTKKVVMVIKRMVLVVLALVVAVPLLQAR